MERFERGLGDPMPYNEGGTLTVREFRAASCTEILWTNLRVMQSFNKTRRAYGSPIFVGYCFRRIWEGGHGQQSQHYAGGAFDVGQNMTTEQRAVLRNLASSLGVWSYVEPAALTPTWVHMDWRMSPPACGTAGYPLLRRGVQNNYVCILQDALNTLGLQTGGLDGIFGAATEQAVRDFQRMSGLGTDGICGCATWRQLTTDVVGQGSTSTTLYRC